MLHWRLDWCQVFSQMISKAEAPTCTKMHTHLLTSSSGWWMRTETEAVYLAVLVKMFLASMVWNILSMWMDSGELGSAAAVVSADVWMLWYFFSSPWKTRHFWNYNWHKTDQPLCLKAQTQTCYSHLLSIWEMNSQYSKDRFWVGYHFKLISCRYACVCFIKA